MKKQFAAACAVERRRLSDEQTRARRRAEAEAVRVIARLEVEDETRRREDALCDAEINLARFGDVAEPIKRSWFAKVLRGADIVVMGRSELEALVATRRAQLERVRTVEAPERLRRADELSELLLHEDVPGEGPVPPAPVAIAESSPTGDEPSAPAVEAPRVAKTATASKPNGRSARSPFG